ncbi:MAG TPA: DUF3097 domain-containing protein [Mycobacteriales bacterium]|jgi:hypothetical protein|nr:DUF3097 domain-containing protein [Mycobacteriales bacterium]
MDYGYDILSPGTDDRRRKPEPATVTVELGMVVEDVGSGYCGAIVELTKREVTLEDRNLQRRVFPLVPVGFLLEGKPVTLAYPTATAAGVAAHRLTASGSVAVAGTKARVARASRIYVEGIHDAALVERVWGEDLRVEGVVVEPLHGIDDLSAVVAEFRPAPERRLGVLVDHLVPGSKEQRIVTTIIHPQVLITGHPYVDIWQAVKPEAVGIRAWPQVPKGMDWKQGVCDAVGVAEPADMWRRILRSVNSYADLQTPLLGAMERLIDFVTDYPS